MSPCRAMAPFSDTGPSEPRHRSSSRSTLKRHSSGRPNASGCWPSMEFTSEVKDLGGASRKMGAAMACARPASAQAPLHERHLEALLVHDRPVPEIAAHAEELAVIGGDDEMGVARCHLHQPADEPVDVLDALDLLLA